MKFYEIHEIASRGYPNICLMQTCMCVVHVGFVNCGCFCSRYLRLSIVAKELLHKQRGLSTFGLFRP